MGRQACVRAAEVNPRSYIREERRKTDSKVAFDLPCMPGLGEDPRCPDNNTSLTDILYALNKEEVVPI